MRSSSPRASMSKAMMSAGVIDPEPLVTHHMTLDEAPEAYEIYDRREALKIVLVP